MSVISILLDKRTLFPYFLTKEHYIHIFAQRFISIFPDKETNQTSKTGHFLIIISALHDFSLVFLSIYNFSSFIFIFDFQEMGGGG
jgi:hypothetical protein